MTRVAKRTSAISREIARLIAWLVLTSGYFGFASPPSSVLPAERSVEVPILVYHRFGRLAVNDMTVTTAQFRSQMRQLVAAGHTVISLRRLIAYLLGASAAPPPCSVVITADDGHRSIYTEMAPVLQEYAFPVTLFVYPSAISNAAWALTWEQLKELKATGLFEIQSHTLWHPNFQKEQKRLDAAGYERFVTFQLTRSKVILEQRLATRVDMLAWPFGISDGWLMDQARQAGYAAGFTLKRVPASGREEVMGLPRFLVTDRDQGAAFERLLTCGLGK
jgi:peptidoglycan/xylan/chitin deacetylase (PgdA/CDA1 family)